MIYRLSYTLDDGRTFVQYGDFTAGTQPFFMNQDLTDQYPAITTLKNIDTVEAAIKRHVEDTGEDYNFVIKFAKTKKGPWTPLTTTHQNLSDLVDMMATL